jgi:colanic acid/amylovoran biosynthesis glycosyltransferase
LIIFLFTASYPYDAEAEQTFLEKEVEYLSSNFDKVVLVPRNCSGNRFETPLNAEVVQEYDLIIRTNRPWQALLSGILYMELARRWTLILKPARVKRLVVFINWAERANRWVCRYVRDNRLDLKQCIFYTYWFDGTSLGVGLAKKRHPSICLVSRAHGGDLYEERNEGYIPCRRASLHLVDKLFPSSDRGTHYLTERYPRWADKYETARLGVSDPGFITSRSKDSLLRMVSCSFLVPVKRVDLILRGIGHAAKLRPSQRFEWSHFGRGDLKKELEILAERVLPSNVQYRFMGHTSQEFLMQFYRQNPVDLFVNLSESEGTPVAAMEAISCGIPIVATAVGGNPEICTGENGILLSQNPSLDEIANALFFFLDQPALVKCKRLGSRRVWDERYNAEKNFKDFVQRLKEIRACLWKGIASENPQSTGLCFSGER